MKNKFYRDVFKAVVILTLFFISCRFTAGVMGILVAVVGMISAVRLKGGLAAVCFIMTPLMVVMNRAIVGVSALDVFASRMGNISIALVLLLVGLGIKQRGERLPIGWMWLYVIVAAISSIDGWMPLVSYLKLINFSMMLIGLMLMAKFMQIGDDRGLKFLRVVCMAIAVIMIVGSVVTYFIPSVGYSMMIYKNAEVGISVMGSELASSEGMVLFNGMACHSQALPPVTIMLASWVLFDMLLIERRVSRLHVGILACVPLLAYMSRSRGALLMMATVIGMTVVYTLPHARLAARVKGKLKTAVGFGVVVLVGIAVCSEMKSNALSRWIRKTDNVAGDQRSLGEAFTGSRQGLIEYNLSDFRTNPLLGTGFQVMRGMKEAIRAGEFTWWSASIEKGVTPYVILGETGILGALAFLIFMLVFYTACIKKKYLSVMTSFTCMLVANLADSTLFSPSYIGGFMWTLTCVGAFSTDILAKRIGMRSNATMQRYH